MCYLIVSDLNVSVDLKRIYFSYDIDSSRASGNKIRFAAILLFELGQKVVPSLAIRL